MAARQRYGVRQKRRMLLVGAVASVAVGAVCSMGGAPVAQAQAQRSEFGHTFETNDRVKQRYAQLGRLQAQAKTDPKVWDQWITVYQTLVDENPDAVLPVDEEFMVGLRYRLHTLLGSQPPNVRQRYRALIDVEARKLWDQAVATGDDGPLRQIISRYRHSSFASQALVRLATQALDTGNPEMARVAFTRAIAGGTVNGSLLLKYALAASAAGHPAEARAALDRATKEFGGTPIKVAGENTTVAAAAKQLGGRIGSGAGAGERWVDFAGPTGERRMAANPLPAELKKSWEYAIPNRGVQSAGVVRTQIVIGGGYGASRSRFQFLTFPVVSGDKVWVQGQRSVAALDLAEGKVAWETEDFTLTPQEMKQPNAANRQVIYPGRTARAIQAVPALNGSLLVMRMPVAGNNRYGQNQWPLDFAMVVMDSRSNKQLWRRIASQETDGQFYNAPAVQDNVVLTGVATSLAGITEYRASALELGTGDPIWTTYLGGGSDNMMATDGSPACVRDGLVWIESSMHTLNALDMLTGEIRHIYKYQPRTRSFSPSGFDYYQQSSNEPVSLLPAGNGPIVFSSRWGDQVAAINPSSAKLLWTAPKGASTTLFAVDKQRAYLCGTEVQAFDMETGAKQWIWVSPGTSYGTGYAALIGNRVYVPVDGKIYELDAETGNELRAIDLTKDLSETPGYTSLLAAGNRLFLSTKDRVFAYEIPKP